MPSKPFILKHLQSVVKSVLNGNLTVRCLRIIQTLKMPFLYKNIRLFSSLQSHLMC